MKQGIKTMITSCVMTCGAFSATQTTSELSSLFVEDTQLLHGQLSNGMTYFVKSNPFDAKKASIRLAVKIGSIHENESERGLAHFVEHMVFRGSEHFKDGEVIKFLESIGAAFGAHTNAYTGFDETVYMLDIPLTDPANLDTGFQILSDFAMKACFNANELEIEKRVVLDEMRQRESASMGRLINTLCENVLQHTPYRNRLPIGLESVIKECKSETMRAFYTRWYRPENMAIIVVGDFESDRALEQLRTYFEPLNAKDTKTEFDLPIIENHPRDIASINNPDNFGSLMFFSSWVDNEDRSTLNGYKLSLIDRLVTAMVNRRFSILAEKENAPFINASMMFQNFIKPKRNLLIQATCWDKRPEQAPIGVMTELQKIKQHSFDAMELELAKNIYLAKLEQIHKNAQNQQNEMLAFGYIAAFKTGALCMSLEGAAQCEKLMLDSISLEQVNLRKDLLLNLENTSVVYFPSEKAAQFHEKDIALAIDGVLSTEFTKEEQLNNSWNLDVDNQAGMIASSHNYSNTGVEQMLLSNGMKVVVYPTDIKKHRVQLFLRADGGIDHADETLLPSAKVSFDYLMRSGLFGLSATQLADVLAGKNIKFFHYGAFDRLVQGSASNEELFHLLKLIHGVFTARNSSATAWKQTVEENDQRMLLKETNSEIQFYDLQNRHNFLDHYAFRKNESKDLDQHLAEKYLDKAFSNPEDFTLFIVGDFDKNALIEGLVKYIASIPKQGTFLPKAFSSFEFPQHITEAAITTSSTKDEASVLLTFPIQRSSLKEFTHFYHLALLENLLMRRCLESLRMKEGETYGVHISSYFPFYPSSESGRLIVKFSCSQDKENFMKNLVLDELKKALSEPFSDQELDKAVEIYKHQATKALLTLEGHKERLLQNALFGADMDHFVQQEVIGIKPASDDLQNLLKALVDLNHYSLCARRPK